MTGLTVDKYNRVRAQSNDAEAVYNGPDFEAACGRNSLKALLAKTFRLDSNLVVPLQTAKHGTFLLSFFSRQSHAYQTQHLQLLKRLRPH
jgi:hypothetical protein